MNGGAVAGSYQALGDDKYGEALRSEERQRRRICAIQVNGRGTQSKHLFLPARDINGFTHGAVPMSFKTVLLFTHLHRVVSTPFLQPARSNTS